MPRTRTIIPGVDKKLLIKDAAKLLPDPTRRLLLRGGLSLGALAVLGGCDIVDSDAAEGVLRKISKFNDGVQALLFNPNTLAPEYPESRITRPFPFNGYYAEDEAPEVDGKTYQLEVGGMIDNKEPWTLDKLYALPQVSQITRHVCVEGWSAIGSGRACGCRNSSSGSAPTPAPNTSGSNAPRAIPTPSTWRRRCIRRPSSASSSTTRSCRASTVSR
jgi:hypothetical protein